MSGVKYRTENPEKAKEQDRLYRQRNAVKIRKQKREYSHRKRKEIRLEVLSYYAKGIPRCANVKCPHYTNPIYESLQLDHINGGGRKERSGIGPNDLLRLIKKNGFPEGYQILCANCNILKALANQKETSSITFKKKRLKVRQKAINYYSEGKTVVLVVNPTLIASLSTTSTTMVQKNDEITHFLLVGECMNH